MTDRRLRWPSAVGLGIAAMLVACESDQDPKAPASEAPVTTPPSTAAPADDAPAPVAEAPVHAATDAPARAEEPAISETSARELLERWVSAQNARKYDDYAALYAPKFFGVKRSGPRVRTYDRATWLADREQMFKRSMKVGVEDVRVQTTARAAVITFEQRWSSRRYADRGPKRIVAVPSPEGLRIASEVMLASELLREFAGQPLSVERFMFALHAGGATYLVLSSHADPGAAAGAPVLESQDQVVAVSRAVSRDAVPEPLRALVGQPVQLLSSGGVACSGVLGEARLMRRVIPHFGTRQYWSGDEPGAAPEDDAASAPLAPAAVAAAAWELAAESTLLVAAVRDAKGSCRDALWGRLQRERAPSIFAAAPASDAVAAEVRAAARALPAYRGEQRAFARSPRFAGGSWDELEGAAVQLRTWRGDRRTFHSYSARAGSGCGDEFYAELWALYEPMGEKLWLLTDGKRPGGERPVAVFDADGDGLVEVLVAPDLYGPAAGAQEAAALLRQRPDRGFDRVQSIAPPFLDCPC